ncbi:uncharacterized protein APUU_70254S [Aspergillus puulaauensis]|uniref:DUF7702 domain-containing protein n=1 Tax=Aspergillus puulaauensis TaxID=1220207 RepID=A0A7R7XWC2_9EURO|nr:uncharacterized protein APUU_70254S [Aspergillus puulaauensis]BCS28684.1 hypothetical protein APUU_70254S [Aspergillus puulaauensis]
MANLPQDMSQITISDQKRSFAIAELFIFSAIHIVQFVSRFIQERRYWHHTKRRGNARCFLYSWWGMIGILAQLRIAASAMMISNQRPSKPMLIAETVLQGIGLSPLLFEVSLVLLRSGQTGRTGPGNSRHPGHLRFTLHFFRFPVIISIVLVLVGGLLDIRACEIVGTVVFVLTFLLVWCILLGMAARSRRFLSAAGYRTVLLVLASLPFLTARVVYFLLSEHGSPRFGAITGDIDVMIGMGLLMEVIASILLIAARMVAEPLWSPLPRTPLC